MNSALPEQLQFIRPHETWALVSQTGSDNSELLYQIQNKSTELISFKHHFRNLSNTTDFYYQQRFNSSDSEDAPTVTQHLASINHHQIISYWTTEKVIEKLNLQSLLDEQLIKLSNGETKRLLIASALLRNPDLLLLDHPFTGLDTHTRQHVNKLLPEIIRTGITVIIATDPHEIPSAASHIAVVQDYKIIHHCKKEDFDPLDFNFQEQLIINKNELKGLLSYHQMSSFDTIIEMKNVTVEYDGKKILNNINWVVKQGERWSLAGPNGAGKSTLLSLVNGDNPQAYANDITLFDRKRGSGESIWDIKKHTGFVSPELYQYFPTDSSCLHVIESGFYDTVGLFRQTDVSKENICMQWMKFMNVIQYANKLFNRVPSDVQRLCLLARALIKTPALLILDEPTQGLSSAEQQFFTRLIDDICALSHTTLIYVSHYEQHIPAAVTKHLRLENGKVIIPI